MPFTVKRLDIPDLILIEPKVFRDDRGFFLETFKESEFSQLRLPHRFMQDNHSRSVKNVLRGLHYQLNPKAQGKLVRCIRGRIYDVGVDLRKGSPSFSRWCGIELSDENHRMLYIPPGFAHGFVVLSDVADVGYRCTAEFSQEHDRGIIWNDPDINIHWHIGTPILSKKDSSLPCLRNAELNFEYATLHA